MEKLAIDGGTPVRTRGPVVETDVFEQEEFDALMEVARMKKLRRAETTVEYERAIASWFGVKHAIAVSSGTTALHIALAAFGIGPGDEVIVTPYTFVASDTAVLEQNAIPIFADIDPTHLTLDTDDIARRGRRLAKGKRRGRPAQTRPCGRAQVGTSQRPACGDAWPGTSRAQTADD